MSYLNKYEESKDKTNKNRKRQASVHANICIVFIYR